METYYIFTLKECASLFVFMVMNSLIMTISTFITTRSRYVSNIKLMNPYYTPEYVELKLDYLLLEREYKKIKSNNIPSHIKDAYITSQINLNTECSLCLDNINSINSSHLTNCGHLFHTECFNQIRMVRNERKCPTCRT